MTDQDFYRYQNRWSKVYFRNISQSDLERVLWINRISGMSSVRILELGAGGGQFAVAACQQGHRVTAIEIEPEFVEHIQKLYQLGSCKNLTIINTDFYTVGLEDVFDLVCYWDGFGIGSDADQRKLLEKISCWLAPGGSVFLEIFTPWYWANIAEGVQFDIGDATRQYGFDAEKSVLTDTWWFKGNPAVKTTQRLRCYSPADMALLLDGCGLTMLEIFPGGKVDYHSGTYTSDVPLNQAMSYIARLVHTDT
jgi:SAM-dependent methyltransferase